MPLQATSGAASYDAFGGGAAAAIPSIEDVFSTYLYTGHGSTQTITNGIDLSGKGGLTWIKGRSGATAHALYDTARGATFEWVSNTTAAQTTQATGLTSFGSTGFSIGALAKLNTNAATYNSWTFRKQPKFFDIVTYTGTGATGQVISHNLGSVPGCIIIKRTSAVAEPYVWHRNLTSTSYALLLNDTSAEFTSGGFLTGTPTSTTFSLTPPSAFDPNGVNGNGSTYVAYLFAHDAGGFGLAGTDNVISCGTYTGNGTTNGPTVTVGFEPQWVMIKAKNATANFIIVDTMRGFSVAGNTMGLFPNLTLAENDAGTSRLTPTATGFKLSAINVDTNALNNQYIYIAIRKGPMKVPTDATKVFAPVAYTGNSNLSTTTKNTLTNGFAADTGFYKARTQASFWGTVDKLRGPSVYLQTNVTDAEATHTSSQNILFNNTQAVLTGYASTSFQFNYSVNTFIEYAFQRAPSFFDVVCYTGTGVARTITHNLGAVPELVIVKSRSGVYTYAWPVYVSSLGNAAGLDLSQNYASAGLSYWNSTTPTSSVFSLNASFSVNESAATYVAYLFATCAGVSKVGTYTGNGSSQTINCGFTGGARFILIKRTSAVGDWYVWDTARGIVAGNDPYLSLNTSDVDATTNDTIDTDSTGFVVNQVATTNVNVTSATYIFLAIA
jgi:hypothetical protein